MKLRCEVIGVSSNGEVLDVRLQGSEVSAAEWRRMGVQQIQIADTPGNKKTYHLGRVITLEIKT